ncbi:MAG TPA: N,N-dimethylformamidase beta subunit family domain-containing protein, partial [Gammaproteobacteria bacterium]|nr:N,N-dimethylformamidase beta subunit family domain-containing protein [Gammaproteobacteria bacterium]
MIDGYPQRASVAAGNALVLHVSTDAPRFRVVFYRYGEALTPVRQSRWLPGRHVPSRGAAADWHWPEYELDIPRDWASAVYIAHLEVPGSGEAPNIAMNHAAALFVVRGSGLSPLLYKIPLATYHAYNFTGGSCFYMLPTRSETPPGSKVSLHRPGGGIGGETWGALDHYDTSSPRQTFAHWDARFIRWLLQNGYAPEFCTDFDVHDDPSLLGRYRLLLSVGHDEYWSEPTRDAVESFIAAGGNAAFFGANICWWRIHVVDEGAAIVCHQGGPRGAFDHWWPKTGANRPEDSLTGVSYRHGGGWWDGPRRTSGFAVQQADHWAFADTGLGAGERFGEHCSPPLVGYECDGAPLAEFDESSGLAVLAPEREGCGTPADF